MAIGHDQAAPADGPDPRSAYVTLMLGFMAALAILFYAKANWLIRLEEAAFGQETAGYTGAAPFMCQGASTDANCRNAYEAAGRPPAILWLGNSQLAAVNRMQPGDKNAPALLRDSLQARGRYLVSYQMPNANLDEHLITIAAVRDEFRPQVILFPICYDDIRELGVRQDVADMIDGPTRRALGTSEWGRQALLSAHGAQAPAEHNVGDDPSIRPHVEAWLVNWLSSHSDLWAKRDSMRGMLGFAVHTLRNKLLGINSQSKRPVDGRLLDQRLAQLEQAVTDLRRQGIQIVLYVPPYRQNVPGPYVEADYANFKQRLAAIAERSGARYLDIDSVVPGPEWGMVTDSLFGFREYDFMHFTSRGHARLAAALDAELKAMGN